MIPVTAIVGPEHTLRQASVRMVQNNTGAAVVLDISMPGPAVISERDILKAIAGGLDMDHERVADHMTVNLVVADQSWPISQAASLMVRRAVRHVLVFDQEALVGVLSMRDVVRVGGLIPAVGATA
ncbi:MAG: CBS domain-containing protein [Thermoleophilia bacterium]|nr:CBS domain-containing protein [Thermoleophilia bacterium]